MTTRHWRWLLGGVGVGNLLCAVLGWATICVTLREATRVEHPAGRAALVGGWAAFSAWWLPHMLNPAKRPVRR